MSDLAAYARGVVSGVALAVCIPAVADMAKIGEPLPLNQIQNVVEIWNRIRADYVDPITDDRLRKGCIAGMSSLDASSGYLAKSAIHSISAAPEGGIGLELGVRSGQVVVVAPIDSSPASQAGISSGDVLLEIDDKAVSRLDLSEIVARLRGKDGSPIRVKVLQEATGQVTEKRLFRAPLKASSVQAQILRDDIVHLKITRFTGDSAKAVRKAMLSVAGKNQPSGVVVDLRNNPGGLLSGVIDVANLFVRSGTIMTMSGRTESSNRTVLADGTAEYSSVPIAILINQGTAAGAEILAEALRTNNGGKVLGRKSFGKGTIQTVMPLLDGSALKITTARWITANGERIEGYGVVPDIELLDSGAPNDGDSDLWLSRAIAELVAQQSAASNQGWITINWSSYD